MIKVYIYSYGADAELAIACVRGMSARAPHVQVTVVDDANHPMTGGQAGRVVQWGGSYEATAWERQGNLNGGSCVRGILETMIRGTAEDDVAIKLDSDTVLRPQGLIARMRAAGAEGFGSCLPDRALCGLCYGFTGAALRRMLAAMDDVGVGEDEPEDVAMARLALAAGVRMHMELPWSASRPDGRWTAYRWPTMPDVARYDGMDVITLGTVPGGRLRIDPALVLRVYEALAGREVTHG